MGVTRKSVTVLCVYFEDKLSSSSTNVCVVYRKNEASIILEIWARRTRKELLL